MLTTRFARVTGPDLHRSTDGTHVTRARPDDLAPRPLDELFNQYQRVMAAAVAEQPRRGLFLFALQRVGIRAELGRLWLAADDTFRRGVIGRHDMVDLPLALDAALSLRHLLFVVRTRGDEVWTDVLDLESSTGLGLADDEHATARRLGLRGVSLLHASGFLLVCIPTGAPLPWDRRASDAFSTLHRDPLRLLVPRGAMDLSHPEGFGCTLTARWADHSASLRCGPRALHRGVVIGRADRCELQLPSNTISRVHAVALEVDGVPLLLDAGSTNGLMLDGRELTVERLQPGQHFALSGDCGLEISAL